MKRQGHSWKLLMVESILISHNDPNRAVTPPRVMAGLLAQCGIASNSTRPLPQVPEDLPLNVLGDSLVAEGLMAGLRGDGKQWR